MARVRADREARSAPTRSTSDRARATHAAVADTAADMFARRGYAQTSMRDLARLGPVSMGAIYLHYKNKADLLVETINRRIADDLESVGDGADPPLGFVDRLTRVARDYPERKQLRALLVQAAAACQTDDETRQRVRAAQHVHVQSWIDGYQEHRDEMGLDESVDVDTAVLYTWALELGLGMLEAFDMEPRSSEQWAAIQRRLARSLSLPRDDGPEPSGSAEASKSSDAESETSSTSTPSSS